MMRLTTLREDWPRPRSRTWAASMTVVLLSLGVVLASAQTSNDSPRFEVASVKPHIDNGSATAGIEENAGAVRITNLPLRNVIAIAYGVMNQRVVGPRWLDGRTFDIVAKPPAGYERQQLATLLRNLLADRFALMARTEQREVQGYALRVESSGHRLRQSTGPRTFLTGRPGLIAGNGRSVTEITPLLARMIEGSVVNETGLEGAYDIDLRWTPTLAGSNTGAVDPEISIFTALREQLGLRLEPIGMTAEFVVVDRVQETPTPD
jgi:uncharacterized protein (TIGR03435 family)